MNVLSLFDGMSCGQIALDRLGIDIKNYFASEIDQYAIKVTQANFPNTKQLGDVRNVTWFDLPRIDLLIGGSPCQGFSFAGKQLNFNDPRSILFFEYVRILKEVEPKYFLLENVKMKKDSQDIITKYLGVEPIEINSALVSAQNRKRLYWTNIPGIIQPKDKGILLEDVLEDSKNHKKSHVVFNYINITDQIKNSLEYKKQYLQYDTNKSNNRSQDQRAYYKNGKHGALTAGSTKSKVKILESKNPLKIRKLTPVECERLQTVPDNYTKFVSDTQRYKMLGNGWTVDVIAHILKGIKK